MQIRIFFIITPVFSVTWSYRNPYNLFDSQEKKSFFISWKKFCCFIFYVEIVIHFIFLDFLNKYKVMNSSYQVYELNLLMHLLNINHFKCLHSLFISLSCMNKMSNVSLFLKSYTNVWIGIIISTKILSSKTVFNIDNNQKCFPSSKSAYLNDFWRIIWHWNFSL